LDKATSLKLKLSPIPGEFSVITVKDSGIGIKAEHLPRIFEPFFTTKQPGEGTGLGLFSVLNAVEQLKGGLHIESVYGKGTTVEVWLPFTTPTEAESRRMQADPSGVLVRGSGTVMVIEDSHLVREVAAEYLRDCGYHVIEAVCVTDAMQWAEATSSQIDVAVVDILMHGMTGQRLVDLIRVWHPRMKSLYITGYSDEYLEARGVSLEGLQRIMKPLKLDDLGRRVRELARPPSQLSHRREPVGHASYK
jgi:two-component system cell cycle sensor histidine kinase/response regulator CckA